ncbi:daptide biosynthesis RiPP recognition protein [Lentzea sp. JNUCC 0626]|uniref:daptide biosynthesis RiPP recognition protein n=1 Tax=Lentzea sp. JNUCC 0626 TaxID=3367513 RepID=UPI00374A768E
MRVYANMTLFRGVPPPDVVRLVTGVWAGTGRLAHVDSVAHLDAALKICDHDDDLVFGPFPGRKGKLVRGEGDLATEGDQFATSAGICRVLSYSTTAARTGSAVVRVMSSLDYRSFLADADRARGTGAFAPFLTDPTTVLGDLCALGDGDDCGGARLARLHVSRSGIVRPTPAGALLGSIGFDRARLTDAAAALSANGDVCLNGVVRAEVISEARDRRPWLSRYLTALHVLRLLRDRGTTGWNVSGFGARLAPADEHSRAELPGAPLLLWRGDSYRLWPDGATRALSLRRTNAAVADIILTSPDLGCARHRVSRHLGTPGVKATQAIVELLTGYPELTGSLRWGGGP